MAHATAAKRLTERVNKPFAGTRVNREAGTIDGVLICGTESANGRDYPAAVLRRDYAVYEGAVVNCDHARESTVDRRFGWFTGVKPGDDGRPRGTLNVLLQHPMAARVFEAAERNPALFGFSHVAMCETTRGKNGREVVEAIKGVESIDLVASPATTKGLFEGRTVPQISFKQFAETCGPKFGPDTWKAMRKAVEEFGDMADAPVMDEPADDATPEDLKSGLMAAIQPMLDDAFESGNSEKVCAAVKDFVKLHAKHTGKGDKAAPKDDAPADADEPKDESKAPTLAGIIAECKAAGLESPPVELVADLMAVPAPATRANFIKRHREAKANAGAEKPKSGGRAPGAAETGRHKVAESKAVPTTAKEFAASIRG
jgi:hypothetical protein